MVERSLEIVPANLAPKALISKVNASPSRFTSETGRPLAPWSGLSTRPSLVLLRCTTNLSVPAPVSSVPCQVPSMSWPCAANAADKTSAAKKAFVTVRDLLLTFCGAGPLVRNPTLARVGREAARVGGDSRLSRGNRHGRAGGAVNGNHQRHLAAAERLHVGKLNFEHRGRRRLARSCGGDLSDAQHRHEHA